MTLNENTKKLLNRGVSFLAGGLLVFAVMNFTVLNDANTEITNLSESLDTSRYEAGRLLEDAKAQLVNEDYAEARASLTALLENQPGSAEAKEGEALLVSVKSAEAKSDKRWESAMPKVREEWMNAMAADIRAKADAEREELEASIAKTTGDAWEKAMEKVRSEWEQES